MNLVFLDTETTGNDLVKDRLCQVCYRTKDGIRTEYFKPTVPISVKSMSITHITNKMVADKPEFQGSSMYQDLGELLKEGVLVAHNAKFDIAMLISEGLSIPRHICTLRVARHLDSEGIIPEYNLQFLRYFLELEVEGNAHDAEGDVNVLYAIFQRLLQKVKDAEKLTDEQAIERLIEISNTPTLYKKINFGKHVGKTLEDIATTDKGYLEWLLKQKEADNEKDEDWLYTLKYYLGRLGPTQLPL
jgi:DNA polymerase III epsilon subunit-like protein